MDYLYLVNDVEHHGQNHDSVDTLPSVLAQGGTVSSFREQKSPKIRPIPELCIDQSRPYRKEGSHARLQHKPELHRPAYAFDQLTSDT
jgi:hypothetical protein